MKRLSNFSLPSLQANSPTFSLMQRQELQTAFPQGQFHIDLRFRRPNPSAFIQIFPLPEQPAISAETTERFLHLFGSFGLHFSFYRPKRGKRKKASNDADRSEETTITHRTLRAVARLLANSR